MNVLRLAPYLLTFGLLGSTLAWQDISAHRVNEDVGTPSPVVDQFAVPTVTSDVPVDPEPGHSHTPDAELGEGGPEVEEDGSIHAKSGSVVIAELTPRDVDPFALVGVTWESGVPADAEVFVQWRGKDGWSDWADLHQEVTDPEEGRPGTEPRWVGWADAVAVRVTSPVKSAPKDLRIATVDPGDVRGITPAAAAQPGIIMRSQWGARGQSGCSSPIYGPATRAAVIHHTVGSNSYSAAQSPGIVRSIQAYHMQANNWCDIGYNFLVDRYGQIFEGRGGGINRPVRAAHSGNASVNEQTMGVSLMGTFSSSDPTAAMKSATARLVAWRFSMEGVPAHGTVSIGGKSLNRISGHRDVVGTECPGQRVYDWLRASGGLRDAVASGAPSLQPVTGMRAVNRSSTRIDYAWNPVPSASRYEIWVSKSKDFSSRRTGWVTGTRAQIGRLGSGITHYARVRALSAVGSPVSTWSPTVAMATLPPPGTAGVPANVTATASSSSLVFAWQAVSRATHYDIRLSRSPSMTSAAAKRVSRTTAAYANLQASTAYYAQVRALDGSGALLGGWSATKGVRTTAEGDASASTPKPVPAAGSYTFRGHGYGHGIGMGQYGAAGAARSGKTYWPILSHYYPGTKMEKRSGSIRVLITADTTRNVKVLGQSRLGFRIGAGRAVTLPTSVGGKKVERWSIEQLGGSKSSLKYRTAGDWRTAHTWQGPSARFEASTIQLILPDDSVRTYRNALVAAHPKTGSSGRDTVNVVSLDDYVRGVLPREMPSTWPAEALKAQAVAARSYGLRAKRTTSHYDICDTTACQVYGGASSERASTNAAVVATAGVVLTYDGAPAFTSYSASTGGHSDKGSQPYLKPVNDPWDNWSGNGRHSWSVAVSAATIVARYPEIGTLRSLQVTSRNGYGEWGGRVTGLKLVGSQGAKTITGNEARSAFGLQSNWFTF